MAVFEQKYVLGKNTLKTTIFNASVSRSCVLLLAKKYIPWGQAFDTLSQGKENGFLHGKKTI
ncbi:MAG: hypothetical protein LBM69_00895, partial [Lachnospiraceae bacterium]|nr:hypothetical protein [Lachnospiraceae bacterium]